MKKMVSERISKKGYDARYSYFDYENFCKQIFTIKLLLIVIVNSRSEKVV